MTPDPPLYIIASVPDSFELAHLPWREALAGKIIINRAKFENFEMVEVIVDAMPFLLSRLNPAETAQMIRQINDRARIADTLPPDASSVGVALTENLSSAIYVPEVHQRLLLLGKWIGESLNASAAVWMPSQKIMSFAKFHATVAEYLDRAPTVDTNP
ncbi:hypothetical protein [Parasphingorhabdus sp.]|uniref:hypothetical protein n=1 Tax=Parasphingorhabdus sp. TaxID=2709688 RepID=UPI003A8C9F24